MNKIATSIFSLIISTSVFCQKIDYNLDEGFIAEGYDVVSYFDNKPQEGKNQFTYEYNGVKFKFSNQGNLQKFKNSPEKYMPQYGGWCAYAMGAKNDKVSIDPETYEIRDGKLYLFYNAFFNNTHEDWIEEGPEKLKLKADTNWQKLKYED